MCSASFLGGQAAAVAVRTNNMTAKETFTRVNLGTFMGLPWEKLRECLLKSRVVELKAYCRDNSLKLPPACKKEELIETILNYRDMGLIKSEGDATASTAIPDYGRISSARELVQRKLSGLPLYEQVTTDWSKETCLLPDFTFMHIYTYLTESKSKTFDSESMKAFKSIKAYK